MATAIAVLFLILWVPLASILSGVALETLWYWFIVPLGAPDLSIAHAMGVAAVVHFITYKKVRQEKDTRNTSEIILSAVGEHLILIGTFLLFGYVIKSFM